jgi:hypothetical protein
MSVIFNLLLQDNYCLFTLTDSLVIQQEYLRVNNAGALQFAIKIDVMIPRSVCASWRLVDS